MQLGADRPELPSHATTGPDSGPARSLGPAGVAFSQVCWPKIVSWPTGKRTGKRTGTSCSAISIFYQLKEIFLSY